MGQTGRTVGQSVLRFTVIKAMRVIVLIITTRIVKGRNMSIKKLITGLTLSLLLSSGMASAADCKKGLQAAQAGDFKTAHYLIRI